ncbi:MAG: YXWGXW repeat-containing protein [Thermodesulfobacteriota bacterium]
MKRIAAIIGLLIVIGGIAVLLSGCPPPLVRVRPPEPRVEIYGPSPYPNAVWRPGYWAYRGGGWVWIPGHWARPPRPKTAWVPGHWEERRGGWVWIPGHWDYR